MEKLLKQDLHAVLTRTPKDIRELIKNHELFLAGGFIREVVAGEDPRDIDLFGPSKDRLKLAATEIWHSRNKAARILETDNAITHVDPPRTTVQFITRWLYDDPLLVIQSLDFTVCQAAVFWDPELKQWDSLIDDRFYPDLASRRLTYTMPQRNEDAGGSMLRVRKFLHRGYHIGADDLALVLARITSRIDFERINNGDEHGQGRIIRSLLREVDPLHIVDGCEPIDIEHEDPLSDNGD